MAVVEVSGVRASGASRAHHARVTAALSESAAPWRVAPCSSVTAAIATMMPEVVELESSAAYAPRAQNTGAFKYLCARTCNTHHEVVQPLRTVRSTRAVAQDDDGVGGHVQVAWRDEDKHRRRVAAAVKHKHRVGTEGEARPGAAVRAAGKDGAVKCRGDRRRAERRQARIDRDKV